MRTKISHRIIVLFLSFTLSLGCLFANTAVAADAQLLPFKDVPDYAFYYNAVLWAANENITTGVSSDMFGSDSTCTRGQTVTFLWRLSGSPAPVNDQLAFNDVGKSTYYYDAICWAVENNIVQGLSQTSFGPELSVTRGQFAAFLYRLNGEPESTAQNPFEDVSDYTYYHDAILWAYENKIATGKSTAKFAPEDTCTRAEAMTFLWRAFEAKNLNAADYGLSPDNSGYQNSVILQRLVNTLSSNAGTIYIPSGEYEFAEIGTQTIGSHCIKMKSNVTIKGDGSSTILKPTGNSEKGLDMFYFNDYVDYGKADYLENCRFEDFVIDAAATSCATYTSAGKGFMFNLFKNCHWENVTVKNTDATGFGVDCPIDSSIVNCLAVNCGKAATTLSPGASGFGIGFGYSEEEDLLISNCQSIGNKKFGFFFEHQRRFAPYYYTANSFNCFVVSDCEASGNYYNFGGIQTMDTIYQDCYSNAAILHGYFFENSKNCTISECRSENETEASFVISQSNTDGGTQEVSNIIFENCQSTNSNYGAKIVSDGSTKPMTGNAIKDCSFTFVKQYDIVTSGNMKNLILTGNVSDLNLNDFSAIIEDLVNTDNSWN